MTYKLLSSIYYSDRDNYEAEYLRRFERGVKLGIDINGYQAFYIDEVDLYRAILAIERINSEISELARLLPGIALNQYEERCLIDEIILTNDIEGVYSTRKEICQILSDLKSRDRKNRFYGLVNKYTILNRHEIIPLSTSRDIRTLYDELFYLEVKQEDPQDLPDGDIFRKNEVKVVNQYLKVVHEGILPESKIIETMNQALGILHDDNIELLIRTALFHYFFGYIHPFYEANGRMSRFISSYMIGKTLHPLTCYRLSYVIKEHLSRYYKAFQTCNDKHDRGDLTPFVEMFLDVLYKACEQLRDDLIQRKERLAGLALKIAEFTDDAGMKELYYYLLQASLFSEHGISTNELLDISKISRPTLIKRLNSVEEKGLLVTERLGKYKYYQLDIEKM